MRKVTFIALLIALAPAARAQGSAPLTNGISILASASGDGTGVTLTIPGSSAALKNSVGVVDIVLNSDTAYAPIVAPGYQS